jgi:hypothetical protein
MQLASVVCAVNAVFKLKLQAKSRLVKNLDLRSSNTVGLKLYPGLLYKSLKARSKA